VAGLLCKNHWFLHEARWAGQDARIQRFILGFPGKPLAQVAHAPPILFGVADGIVGP